MFPSLTEKELSLSRPRRLRITVFRVSADVHAGRGPVGDWQA